MNSVAQGNRQIPQLGGGALSLSATEIQVALELVGSSSGLNRPPTRTGQFDEAALSATQEGLCTYADNRRANTEFGLNAPSNLSPRASPRVHHGKSSINRLLAERRPKSFRDANRLTV